MNAIEIRNLCKNFGEKQDGFYTFPTAEKLASLTLALVLLLTGCATPVSKQENNDESTTVETTTEPITEKEIVENPESLQELVEKVAKQYGATAIQVATIKDGQVSSTAEYGWAVRGVREVDSDTKIRIASLSKTALAMVVFRLIEEGKLELDRDISDYLGVSVRHPYYPDEVITLRLLLTHTSGLSSYAYQYSLEAVQSYLQRTSSYIEKPGAKFRYNNYGFGIVTTICEIVTGKSMNMLVREYFLDPMGIEGSFLAGQLNPDQVAALYENTYSLELSVAQQTSYKDDVASPAAYMGIYAGGLTISAKDFAKLLTIFINGGTYLGEQYLTQESIDQIQTPQVPDEPIQCMPVKKMEGLYNQEYMYYHTGSAYGTYNLYAYNPDTKEGLVVITVGAWNSRDRYNVYSVCGSIADAVFEQDLL